MASMIQVRVDDELKEKSEALFRKLGIDTTSAIRMFLVQAIAQNGLPFEVKVEQEDYSPFRPLTEDMLLTKLETARKHADQKKYRDADEVVSDMRTRYGL